MNYRIQELQDITDYEQLGCLASGIESCIGSAFGGTITPMDARHHMAGQQVLVATNLTDGEVHGFASASVISPREVFEDEALSKEAGLYLIGAAIHRDAQGRGLYHILSERRINFGLVNGVGFVFTRTQNPRVQEGISHLMDRYVQSGRIPPYEVGRVICEGAYGRMLTTNKPVARELVFDDIDYDRGDAAVITWKFAE